MRLRNVILAGTGILTVCAIALALSVRDYTTQPGVANAHVGPVVARPLASASGQTSAPMPTKPVTAEPAPQPASAAPAEAQAPGPPAAQSQTHARVVQQPRQASHHSSRSGSEGRGEREGSDGSDGDD